jgi:hypothetical protein
MTHRIITAEEARTLREAATPGPWHVGRSALCDCLRPCVNVYADQGEDVTRPCRSEVSEGDAPLLAAAPDLAATVEALHAEVERLRDIERWAGELLARIHGDGGHHINDVGWEQAFLDADDRVVEWLGRCADAALEDEP